MFVIFLLSLAFSKLVICYLLFSLCLSFFCYLLLSLSWSFAIACFLFVGHLYFLFSLCLSNYLLFSLCLSNYLSLFLYVCPLYLPPVPPNSTDYYLPVMGSVGHCPQYSLVVHNIVLKSVGVPESVPSRRNYTKILHRQQKDSDPWTTCLSRNSDPSLPVCYGTVTPAYLSITGQ